MSVTHGLPEYLQKISPPPWFEPRTFQHAANPVQKKKTLSLGVWRPGWYF